MPELPEVETVVRTLARHTLGRRIVRVQIHRPDVVRQSVASAQALCNNLLQGQRIDSLLRHGKQLALVAERKGEKAGGPCVCVHLGMSGSLCVVDALEGQPPDLPPPESKTDHVHLVWELEDGTELRFRDPRRFGGLWTFPDTQSLRDTRWSRLGPDALEITPGQLYRGLSRTRRALKAVLLDQQVVAGLGNIYVDEVLYTTRLHPLALARDLGKSDCVRLVRNIRRILSRAIDAGGSTLRDYVDATGQTGGFQTRFRAYGRAGEVCARCERTIERLVVAGRTTSACSGCQRREGIG